MATAAIGYRVLPFLVWAFARMLTGALSASLWIASELGSGADGWTIAMTVAQAVAGAVNSPKATVILLALVVASALALFGLQRLLDAGHDRDLPEKDQES